MQFTSLTEECARANSAAVSEGKCIRPSQDILDCFEPVRLKVRAVDIDLLVPKVDGEVVESLNHRSIDKNTVKEMIGTCNPTMTGSPIVMVVFERKDGGCFATRDGRNKLETCLEELKDYNPAKATDRFKFIQEKYPNFDFTSLNRPPPSSVKWLSYHHFKEIIGNSASIKLRAVEGQHRVAMMNTILNQNLQNIWISPEKEFFVQLMIPKETDPPTSCPCDSSLIRAFRIMSFKYTTDLQKAMPVEFADLVSNMMRNCEIVTELFWLENKYFHDEFSKNRKLFHILSLLLNTFSCD